MKAVNFEQAVARRPLAHIQVADNGLAVDGRRLAAVDRSLAVAGHSLADVGRNSHIEEWSDSVLVVIRYHQRLDWHRIHPRQLRLIEAVCYGNLVSGVYSPAECLLYLATG